MTELVEIKESPGRGQGLFAKRDIKNGDYVAMYRVVARPNEETDPIYGVVLPTLTKESFDDKLTGVPIKDTSISTIKDGILIRNIAMYINEPGPNESSNVDILMNRVENLIRKNKQRADVNDIFDYYFYATRDIKAGEELLWYYGPYYNRNYSISKLYPDLS